MRDTLFGRTAIQFLALIITFQLILFTVSWIYILRPLLHVSVQELASLITLSARTWVELPPERRVGYLKELRENQRLQVEPARGSLSGSRSLLPYLNLLEKNLSERSRTPVSVVVEAAAPTTYALDLPAGNELLRFRFTHDRIGTNPGLAFLAVVSGSILLGVLAALWVARGLTLPLAQLAQASTRIGRGKEFTALPEQGPREMVILAREFNRMAEHVRELVDNRTTLLAGVSHDLRSPLARLRLALELCRDAPRPQFYERMETDLETMNALIGEFLDFSRGASETTVQDTDLVALLGALADSARRQNAVVEYSAPRACIRSLSAHGLRRVLANLLDNAVRYGAGQPIDLVLQEEESGTTIEVRDRGPGIPPERLADVFRPFVRLENSRNTGTGGNGLGLAIVRQLADTHGWTVSLAARAGGGTVARVIVPSVPAQL